MNPAETQLEAGLDFSRAEIDHVFRYHSPTDKQRERYETIRSFAWIFAETLRQCCPASKEKLIALAAVRSAVMWANAAIACNEPDAEDVKKIEGGEPSES